MIRSMLRCLALGFIAGLSSALLFIGWLGPDALIQGGLKLQAAQQSYAYDARPMLEVDDAQIVAELARPVRPLDRKGGRR